jgi:hypothetical protein
MPDTRHNRPSEHSFLFLRWSFHIQPLHRPRKQELNRQANQSDLHQREQQQHAVAATLEGERDKQQSNLALRYLRPHALNADSLIWPLPGWRRPRSEGWDDEDEVELLDALGEAH